MLPAFFLSNADAGEPLRDFLNGTSSSIATPAGVAQFGRCIAMDGDWLMASCADSSTIDDYIYVYENVAGTWTQRQVITTVSATSSARSGVATTHGMMSISGDLMVATAPEARDAGLGRDPKAFVYKRSGTSWSLVETIFMQDYNHSGACSLDGARLVLVEEDDQLYLYTLDANGNATLEQGIFQSGSAFASVSVDGDTAIASAARDSSIARIYDLSGDTLTTVATISDNDIDAFVGSTLGLRNGFSTSIYGDYAAFVAAGQVNGGVVILSRIGANWSLSSYLSAVGGPVAMSDRLLVTPPDIRVRIGSAFVPDLTFAGSAGSTAASGEVRRHRGWLHHRNLQGGLTLKIKVVDGSPVEYSVAQLMRDNRSVSFTQPISEATLTEYGLIEVAEGSRPDADVVEPGPIELVNGQWTQTYTGRSFTAEEATAQLAERRAVLKVSMRQARLALAQQGLLSSVEASIAAMDEPHKTLIGIEWEYAHIVERNSPWMAQMAAGLGLTDEQMDALFELALTL